MSRVSTTDKLAAKRQAWITRTASALAISVPEAEELLSTKREQSLRLNSLVADPGESLAALQALGWSGQPYAWAPDCFSIETATEAVRDSDLVANGAVFIQNAASWLPVLALDPQPGDSILDVCAAPGGKTSHMAALAHNQAAITANDNSRPRLIKLQNTCQRLAANVSQYTLYDARFLARKLGGHGFNKILLDAPCSGEGLMHLGRDKDFATWSVAHIKRLQQLQKRLITQAWQLLEPGGTLVYSTCTMAPEENEAVIDYALRACESAEIEQLNFDLPNRVPAVQEWNQKQFSPLLARCLRLKPSTQIEAFFVCKLRKPA